MGYKYTINIHDEGGEMLVEHELTSDQAILIVARALADTKRQQMTGAAIVLGAQILPTPPVGKKQYKKRATKEAAQGDATEESPAPGGEKSPRKSLDDQQIVGMTGASIQLVKYHRKAMIGRGEIDN